MSREEAIEILSDMRAEYNLFGDEEEATRYHVLSWAIQEMKATQQKIAPSDIEEAVEYIKNAQEYLRDIGETWCANYLSDSIDLLGRGEEGNAPITVQELVRCRDCKWYEIYQLKQDGTDDRRYKPSYCTLFRHRFKPDWYCADGRRGEEDETD